MKFRKIQQTLNGPRTDPYRNPSNEQRMFIGHLTRLAGLSISRTASGSTSPLGYGKFGEQTMLKVRIQMHLRVIPHARL